MSIAQLARADGWCDENKVCKKLPLFQIIKLDVFLTHLVNGASWGHKTTWNRPGNHCGVTNL